jgi:hypothetical protein
MSDKPSYLGLLNAIAVGKHVATNCCQHGVSERTIPMWLRC